MYIRNGLAWAFTAMVWLSLADLPSQTLAQSRPVLPQGGVFAAGSGTIGPASGGSLTITQNSARGVIDWTSFSLGAGNRVFINNGAGATLSRVSGGDLSRIDGLLKSTGSFYLINPNGVIVGSNACISTGGTFLASTRNIATDTFMAGGAMAALGTSAGSVINRGTILAREGDVLLIGRSVENSGSIRAPKGAATLATGDSVLLTTIGGPGGIYVAPGTNASGNITQTGRIEAAAAALKAAGGDIYTLAGNRSGLISATGTKTINGEVWLSAPNGKVLAGGDISARNADGTGGQVVANGRDVTVAGTARISAEGSSGGKVLVGVSASGGTNLANSTTVSDGASIRAGGPGGGGTVETSGHAVSIGAAQISAGQGGQWQVDPVNLTVDAAAASTITSSLNSGTNVTEQTTATTASGPGVQAPGAGDITVAAPITWTGSGNLTLSAYNNLNLNAAISGAGALSGSAGGSVAVNANVSASHVGMTANGGNLTLASGVSVAGANGVTLQTSGNFINNAGAGALSSSAGNWLVYSSNPSSDTVGGLSPNFLQYAAPGGTTPAGTGNGLLYSVTPSLSVALSGTVAKTYDGTTAANFSNTNAAVSGLINGDAATVTGTYANKNVGTGLGVTASNIAVAHNGIPVYGYSGTTPSVSANIGEIDPATITASIVGNPTKVYNGTTTATLGASNYQLTGFAPGEGASVNQPSSVAYDSPDAGMRTVSATFNPTNFVPNAGTSLSNYLLPGSATGAGTINPAPLLIRGVLATDKVYDRTTTDTLNTSAASLYGIIGSDDVSLVISGATGTFATANAGSNIPVTATAGFSLSGTKAGNYVLTPPAGLTANIAQAGLTISGVTAQNKVYDATNTAGLNTAGATLNGVISGDTLTLQTVSTGTFATSDVGTGIAVNASGFAVSGASVNNYKLTQPAGLAANITPKPVSVAITSTPTKTYNGDTNLAAGSLSFGVTGFVSGQSATINQTAQAAYATPNAGTQAVTANLAVSDYTAGSGTKLSNYILPTTATGTGVINPAPLTISIVGNPTKTYDGTIAAILNSSNYLLSGFLTGQSATINKTSGVYASANAGVRQVTTTLTGADFTPGSGTLLSNYSFPTTVSGFGTILPAPIAGSIYASIIGNPTKTYDGTTVATLSPSNFQLTGFAQGQGATVNQTIIGQYAGKDVGIQPITANLTSSDFTPNAGTNLSNYTMPTVAYGSGTINPATLIASIIGNPTKVYNGTTAATVTPGNFSFSGLASGEGINISPAVKASYDAPQAGSRTVTANIAVTDITPQSGTLLSNYVLPTSATGNGQITQAPLSILGVAAQNKTYDTTSTATLATGGAHLFGVVGSDNVTLSTSGVTGAFATPNAGSNIAVTASGFGISGSDAANYQLFQPTGLSANILPKSVSITGVSALNKNYDNTNTASLSTGSAGLSGVFASDTGQVSLVTNGATAFFPTVNVGANLNVTASGFSLTGNQASNYALNQPTGLTANINPAPLTAVIVGNPTKVYDGSPSTTLRASNYQLLGFANGQGASVPQSATAQYVSPNAGTQGITSTLASSDFVANSGTDLSNYILPTTGSGTGTITPAPLTAAIIGNPTKTYNGTTAATLTSSNYALSGFIGSQSATVSQTAGTYNIPDAGSRTVTATLSGSDFTAGSGTNLNNYTLPTTASGPGTIDKAPLQVVSVFGTSRPYNGGTADTLNIASAGVSGLFGSDTVTLNTGSATGVFASKDVGTGIAVTASGFTISGGQSADYNLLQPTGLSADITQATLNLTNVTRIYDSTTGLPTTGSAYTLSGIFGSDAVSVDASRISGNYADKNVGINKNVTLSGLALTGAQAPDYTIASSLTNAPIGTITQAPLTVTGIAALNKVYDGTTHADLNNTSAALSGLFAGDAVTLDTSRATGSFNNKNVGTGKPVTLSGYTASGADYGNYNFTQPSAVSANITPFTGISLSSVTKTYDGGTSLPTASAAYGLSGVIGSDSVQVDTTVHPPSGGYGSSDVGSGLTINLSGLTLSGTDAANYSINPTVSNANIGTINPKTLTAGIINNPTKTYDTTTAATLGSLNYSISGFVSGQGATVTKTTGAYASANAGTQTVSTSLASGDFNPNAGTSLSNYVLPTTASGNGTINKAPLTITGVQATNKVYNGNTADPLNTTSAALSGVFAADSGLVTLSGGAGTFASPNVGTGISVTASGFTIAGSKAGNYSLSQPTGLSADITQAILNLSSVTKMYDATTSAVGGNVSYTLSGIVGSDVGSVSLDRTNLAGTFAAKNVGTGLSVSMTGLALTGAKSGNYSIAPNVTNSLIGTITKAPLTVAGAVAVGKVYDGTTAATINNSNTSLVGVLGSDTVNLTSPITGTFASANAGTQAVTPGSNFTIFGTDAGNYNLTQPSGFSATITPAPLSASIINNPTKTYSGTTTANLTSGNYSLSGFVAGQGATVNQSTGTYDTADAGSRTVTAALSAGNFTPNGGTLLSNYTLPTTATGAGAINPKAITAAIAGNPTKTYDGGTATTLGTNNYTLSGFVSGQGAAVTQTAGTYDAPDAGGRTVTATLNSGNFTPNGGTNLSNYTLPTTASGAGTINPKTLGAAITGDPTKTYDGGTGATLASSDYTLSGFIAGQGATVNQTAGTYDTANAGARTVTATLTSGNFTPNGGTNLSNYTLPTVATGAGSINPKTLTAVITGNPAKTYDGTLAATLNSGNYIVNGFVAGQGASVNQTAGTYDAPDAGTRTVTTTLAAGNFNPNGGTSLSNYVLPTSATGTGTINPKTLTAAISGNPSKVYDATTAATLGSSDYALTGFIAGQGATVNQTAGSYDTADAGARTVTAALSAGNFSPNNGTNLSNYTLPTTATGAGTINPKALGAAIIGDPTKTYDGTTAITLGSANYALSGFVAGQGATVNQTTGTYDMADAGSRTITAALNAGNFNPNNGTNLSNYTLPTSVSGAGTIDPKAVTAAITGAPSKVYDGGTAATLGSGDYTLSGFIAGQGATVNQTAGAYDTSDAGARTVTAALGQGNFSPNNGTNLNNYALPSSATGAGIINPRALAASITGNPTKAYDSGTGATLGSNDYTLNGFVAGQGANVNQTTGSYDTADAGARTVTASLGSGDFAPKSGTNLNNYILPTTASGAGTIDPKALTATVTGNPTKTYDGTTAAALTASNYALDGFVAGQGATVNQTVGSYDIADAGTRTVTASLNAGNFTANNGTNLSNYTLPTTANGAGAINPKALTAAITGNPAKAYDGTTAATLNPGNYSLSGFIAGQGATVTQTAGTYDTPDAGARTVNAALSASDFAAAPGTSLSNYVLPTSAAGAGQIDPKVLTATVVNAAKTYDGSSTAVLNPANFVLTGFAGGQGATITQTTGSYASPDAGSRTVTSLLSPGDFILTSGTNSANYILPTSASGMGLIHPKGLVISIVGNPAKTYDGTVAATLGSGNYALTGFVTGQGATVNQTAGTYDMADAGLRTIVTALTTGNFTAAPGTDLGNYILPSSAMGAGMINPKALGAAIIGAPTKMADGTLLATLTPVNIALSGFIAGQGAIVNQPVGSYDSTVAGSRIVTAVLSSGNFVPNTGTRLANYILPVSATGAGLITPAVRTDAPTLAEAIISNLAVRNLAPAPDIGKMAARAVFAAAVPRAYIPYPAPSTLSTWQNNGFASLPAIVDTVGSFAGASGIGDWSIFSGPPVINSTEQILLQGGKQKSWHITLPLITLPTSPVRSAQ